MTNEVYTLGEAIARFERLEDRKEREAAREEYFSLIAPAAPPDPSAEETAAWRAVEPNGSEPLWRLQRREKFDRQRRIAADEAARRLKQLEKQQARGLMEKLRAGVVVIAIGHVGGMQNPKNQIPANVWTSGDWEFQGRANFARGGDPVIEIHGLRIVETAQAQADVVEATKDQSIEATTERDQWRDLPQVREAEVQAFLDGLEPCNEATARQKAEDYSGARISKFSERFKWPRRHVGRPRKSAE